MLSLKQSGKILCLDFDGVLHSYTSGWKGANVISDPPVPGAMEFLSSAVERFHVYIYSSRSHQDGGIDAMQKWLDYYLRQKFCDLAASTILREIKFPVEKPPAHITIDDRAICFDGSWPDLWELVNFSPWNAKSKK